MTTRTKRRPTQSELSQEICRQVVLRDAKAWYKRDYPRMYVRPKSIKHPDPKVKNQIDRLFAAMNVEIDEAMMIAYAKLYERYGGDLSDLPWSERRIP